MSRSNFDRKNKEPIIRPKSFIDEGKFTLTRIFSNAKNAVKGFKTWSEILEGKLYLGMIPTKEMADEIKSKIKNLKLVVSAVEPFELEGGLSLDEFETPTGWNQRNVDHHWVVIKDFGANISNEKLYDTLKQMHQVISEGGAVYVHCKAGVGRSAMIVLAYLAIYETNLEFNDIPEELLNIYLKSKLNYLLDKRPQVVIKEGTHQYNKVLEMMNFHLKQLGNGKEMNETPQLLDLIEDKHNSDVGVKDVQKYLLSAEVRELILQLPSCKNLLLYGSRINSIFGTRRVEHINTFIRKIQDNDFTWLADLMTKAGPIKNLIVANPYYDEEKLKRDFEERSTLIKQLDEEITNLIRKKFPTSPMLISQLIEASNNYKYTVENTLNVEIEIKNKNRKRTI